MRVSGLSATRTMRTTQLRLRLTASDRRLPIVRGDTPAMMKTATEAVITVRKTMSGPTE